MRDFPIRPLASVRHEPAERRGGPGPPRPSNGAVRRRELRHKPVGEVVDFEGGESAGDFGQAAQLRGSVVRSSRQPLRECDQFGRHGGRRRRRGLWRAATGRAWSGRQVCEHGGFPFVLTMDKNASSDAAGSEDSQARTAAASPAGGGEQFRMVAMRSARWRSASGASDAGVRGDAPGEVRRILRRVAAFLRSSSASGGVVPIQYRPSPYFVSTCERVPIPRILRNFRAIFVSRPVVGHARMLVRGR